MIINKGNKFYHPRDQDKGSLEILVDEPSNKSIAIGFFSGTVYRDLKLRDTYGNLGTPDWLKKHGMFRPSHMSEASFADALYSLVKKAIDFGSSRAYIRSIAESATNQDDLMVVCSSIHAVLYE